MLENGYAVVTLSQGESVTYTMDMPFVVHKSSQVNPDVDDLFAVTRGPIVLCADSIETDLYQGYALKTQDGYAVGKVEAGAYVMELENGETLTLREYGKTGKNYYTPREMSVWLKTL